MVGKPKNREIYACHHGDYAGQVFVFINEGELSYNFIRMPDMANISVPHEDFYNAVRKEILQFIEAIPEDVYKVVQAQYNKNENTDN
jgi:hypothetical protein